MEREKRYLLQHYYEYGEEEEYEEIKTLGIYSSREKASEAIERYFKLKGFRDYPKDCFYISEFPVDEDYQWWDGFVSTDEIEQDFEKLTSLFNCWLGIDKPPRDSWEDDDYYNRLCEVHEIVYRIDDVGKLAKALKHIWENTPKCYKKLRGNGESTNTHQEALEEINLENAASRKGDYAWLAAKLKEFFQNQ